MKNKGKKKCDTENRARTFSFLQRSRSEACKLAAHPSGFCSSVLCSQMLGVVSYPQHRARATLLRSPISSTRVWIQSKPVSKASLDTIVPTPTTSFDKIEIRVSLVA